jgi:hypothetical protein
MALDETFFDIIRIRSGRFMPHEPMETNRLANGDVLSASLGAALWRGEAVLSPAEHVDAQEVEARLDRLQQPGEYFLICDWRRKGPRMDPGGAVLGASSPTVLQLGSDNKSLRLQGLPAGYVLSAGDQIGWLYGQSPERRALHSIYGAVTADGTGVTPFFEVSPHIRPGVAVNAAVELVRPMIKARLLSWDYGASDVLITEGAKFSFIQKLG